MQHITPTAFEKSKSCHVLYLTNDETSIHLLRDVKALLCDEEQWIQKKYSDRVSTPKQVLHRRSNRLSHSYQFRYQLCIVGALSVSAGADLGAYSKAIELVARLIPDNGHSGFRRITRWNDAPHRTFADVSLLIRQAIDVAHAATNGIRWKIVPLLPA